MFNMKMVGRKIALLRKEKDLTQMELADMLNISYQAKDIVDKFAQSCIENEQILLDELLPFISREWADRLVEKALELNFPTNILINALPFISKGVADKIARKCIENNDLLIRETQSFVDYELLNNA